ncbi:MAG: hypothetical protein ACTHMG_00520, partial [Sphingomonas sp.]
RRILNLLSFGAVLENIVLRAAALGFAAEVRPGASAGGSEIAAVVLRPGTPTESELERAIPGRHVNRSVMFRGPPLDALTRQLRTATSLLDLS